MKVIKKIFNFIMLVLFKWWCVPIWRFLCHVIHFIFITCIYNLLLLPIKIVTKPLEWLGLKWTVDSRRRRSRYQMIKDNWTSDYTLASPIMLIPKNEYVTLGNRSGWETLSKKIPSLKTKNVKKLHKKLHKGCCVLVPRALLSSFGSCRFFGIIIYHGDTKDISNSRNYLRSSKEKRLCGDIVLEHKNNLLQVVSRTHRGNLFFSISDSLYFLDEFIEELSEYDEDHREDFDNKIRLSWPYVSICLRWDPGHINILERLVDSIDPDEELTVYFEGRYCTINNESDSLDLYNKLSKTGEGLVGSIEKRSTNSTASPTDQGSDSSIRVTF